MTGVEIVPTATTAAPQEVSVLRKTLGRLDIVFLAVSAIIGIDLIAEIAAIGGAEAFTWAVVIAVTFLYPTPW